MKAPFFLRHWQAVLAVVVIQMLMPAWGHGSPGRDGWIGVYVQDLDEEMREYYDIKESRGVIISEVVRDSPAEKAGLQDEDVIIAFDGKRLRDTRDLVRAVRRTKPGEEVTLEIVRDNRKEKIKLTVEEQPRRRYRYRQGRAEPRFFGFRFHGRPRLGIRMADLNSDLAAYFGVDADAGVLVLTVLEDSPAEQAGLKAGDIITEIQGSKTPDTEALLDALRDFDRGDEVKIIFIRKKKQQSVKVELAGRDHHSYEFDAEDWRAGLDRLEDLNIHLRHLGDGLQIQLEGLGDELGAEMEDLARDLQDLDIEIRLDRDSI